MRPSRIIVGEVRAEECLDLLLALNAGLPGMCTVHANSAREAVTKMCTLPLLAGLGRVLAGRPLPGTERGDEADVGGAKEQAPAADGHRVASP